MSRQRFKVDNPSTWDTKLIDGHWNARKEEEYKAMTILIVVTEDMVPSKQSAQQYTITLKKNLIEHFRSEGDKRVRPKTTVPGKLAKKGEAFVLYLAIQFKDDESSSESSS